MELLLQMCQGVNFLLQIAVLLFTCMSLLNCKMKNKVVSCLLEAALSVIIIFSGRLMGRLLESTAVNAIFSIFVLMPANMLFYRDKWSRKLLLFGFMFLNTVIIELSCSVMAVTTMAARGKYVTYTYENYLNSSLFSVLGSIYSSLIFFICYLILQVVWKVLVDRFWIREYLLYLFVPVYQMLLLYIYYSGCVELHFNELLTGGMMVAFSLLLDMAIIYLVKGMEKKLQVDRELEALYNQKKIEHHYYEAADASLVEMEEMKKEFRGQLQQIYELLQQEEKEQARELLDQSRQRLQERALPRYCENSIINSILTMKNKVAAEKKIKLESACFLKEDLPMELIDVCSLFSNLLDNAIEACQRIPESGEAIGDNTDAATIPDEEVNPRRILIQAGERGGFLIIKVENTYVHELKEGFLTSKEDKVNHGYGLKLVDRIVKKYKGDMEIRTENSIFRIMLSFEASV